MFLSKIKTFLDRIYTRFHPHVNKAASHINKVASPHVQKAHRSLKEWLHDFKTANTKERFHMLKLPLIVLIVIICVAWFGPLLKPPFVSSVYPNDKSIDIEFKNVQIEIGFDRPVAHDSVEASFFIEPEVSGEFEWRNDQAVIFIPNAPLERGRIYTYGFKKSFSSTYHIPSIQKYQITFTTLGKPKIVFKAPELETPESRTPITVVFSQPMHALTTATDSASIESIFTVNPPIKGSGRWLGTSAYQFTPDENYRQATNYTVAINPQVKSIDGFPLDGTTSWQFSGTRPRVANTGPPTNYYGTNDISPTASVSAYMNLPINSEISLADYFQITDSSNKQVPGSILVQKEANAMHFRPFEGWKRGEGYKAIVRKGFTTLEGPNPMEDDYTWSFRVLPDLAVTQTYPTSGEKYYEGDSNISIQFNAPLSKNSTSINEFFSIEPPIETFPKVAYLQCGEPCTYVTLNGKFKRETHYKVTIKKDVTDIYGSSLKKDYQFTFTTAKKKSNITISPAGLQVVVLNQNMPAEVFTRVLNSNKITYRLYKFSEENFLEAERASYQDWEKFHPPQNQLIKTWNAPVEPKDDEYVKQSTLLTDSQGNKINPGYYFFEASIPEGPVAKLAILASRTTITVKTGGDKLLAWVTDQTTNQTVSGMNLRVTDKNGHQIDTGTTNSDGVAFLKIPKPNKNVNDDRSFYIFGHKDDDVTVTGTRWSFGISHWDFGLPYYNYHDDVEYPIYIVFDRPLYRPGQEVMYKGILRKDTDGAFETIPAGEEVTISIKDSKGNEFYSEKKQLTSFGTFSGKFTVSKDGALGSYTMSAKYTKQEKEYTQYFQVEEYKRQDFKVVVKPFKDDFISGDNLKATINASYYFGAPIKKAATYYTVKAEDYYFHWDKSPQYEFGQPDSYWYRPWSESSASNDKSLTEVRDFTDNNGDVSINLPIDMSAEKQSKRIIVDVGVSDINNQTVGASEEIFFHKSGTYVGVKPHDYVSSTGKDTAIDVVTLDTRANEVGNKPVSLDIYRITWVTTREEDQQDGAFYYRNTPVETLITSVSANTDEHGYGSGSFVPKQGGTYKVVAKVSDDKGNTMASNTYFWVSGDEFESTRENHDRIPLITDKYNYQRGENATVFISTPYGPDTAKTLITYERGSIMDYKVIDINEKNTTYTFPVSEKMIPNVYVSAVLMRGSNDPQKPPEFKIGYTELRVNDDAKKLMVEINTDKERYNPRDTVNTTIQVKDAKGNPHKAELSLALVDRSLLDLATVSYRDPYSFFFEPRILGVDTSQSLTFSLNRLNANVNSDSKGGDGDDQSKLSTKRKFFPETDYWNAHITTDDQGRAKVNIPLADNLTTWKFTAVANSAGDAFGMGTKEILATKDVLIRSFTPRFLAVDDESVLGGIILNKSDHDLNVNVELKATGLTINEPKIRQVQIAKGEEVKVVWRATAQPVSNAIINVIAKSGDKTLDDIEVTVPIVTYHTPETTATSGEVSSEKTEKVRLPKEIVANKGSLDINVSSSLVGSTIQAMSYLIDYPYGCTEQTTSRFYAAIPLYYVMKSNDIKSIGSQTQEGLLNVITVGVQKLQNEQKTDGGWGWWVESLYSDPFLTAYAYQALTEARDAKLSVSDGVINSARSYLIKQLGTNNYVSLDTQSFIVYVLRNDKSTSMLSYIDNLFDNRIKLSTEGKAYLWGAMYKQGSDKNRQARLRDEIMSITRKSSTGVHWEEKRDAAYTILGSDTGSTALVLETLLQIDPHNPLLSEVARYFQASLKNNSYWYSTRSTSVVLHALIAYAQSKGDFGSSYSYKTLFNGSIWKTGTIQKNSLGGVANFQKPMSQLSPSKENTLKFIKDGSGNLYYNMNLRYYLPYTEIAALDRGITVIREYEDDRGTIIKSNKIKAGSLVRVRLTIVLNDTRHKMIVEDKLPAGLEALNENLRGTISNPPPEKKLNLGTWPLYYDRKEYRDDRVVTFTDTITPGVYELTYLARATTPGKYHRPPAQAYEMYMPDIMGHTEGGWFEVVE